MPRARSGRRASFTQHGAWRPVRARANSCLRAPRGALGCAAHGAPTRARGGAALGEGAGGGQPGGGARPEPTTKAAVFEGLFDRVLRPRGAFAAELREAGYDPQHRRAEYPTHVFHACLEVARRHAHPGLSVDAANHQLGRALAEGYLSTLVGALVSSTFPLLGPDGVLRQLHRVWARGQPDVRVVTERVGERHWRVLMEGGDVLAHVGAGSLERGLEPTGAHGVRCEVLEAAPTRFVLRVTWQE